ncbi:hypothetical protein PACTADRAFT_44864 [Pachysolen tannophilus NRRL Y-2460]|uniref:RNA polymerase II subunit A C-terminal domain phosphatase n=1 Tax=Pachysolen tannophilus NRRL Y-2460 TaxID=669874 RepID=A0A1E4TR20_PACTA|nr:hypothetical protein PACTADRAFT_44864 [Pachysolen tannophilus NRRL Y-2460]
MSTTSIKLPKSVPFPVVVVSVLMKPNEHIDKHTTVLKYKYWEYREDPKDSDKKVREEFGGSFEIPVSGELKEVKVQPGDEIIHSEQEIATILEPCKHSIQYGGLCALCGADLEEIDYLGYNYQDRAQVTMSYGGSSNLKVSMDEAEKLEQISSKRLLKEEKLILVVDLDQTVIHATVDPTVGEWKNDPSNPNYEAVKDVQQFALEESVVLPLGYTGPKPPPSICWYYVKLRPGLKNFLEKISERYEMHIYTMATRAYAKNIAKIIDPDGKYFSDRILSRDESGSLTQKSLKRLFPVDQSMVVVIDDRGDVWNWSPNLIKVIPYDFFVGIGDINSSFLPRQNTLLGPSKRRKSVADLEEKINAAKELQQYSNDTNAGDSSDAENDEGSTILSTASNSPVDRILALGGGEDNADLLAVQSSERSASLEQQQHERPLAKLQHDLDRILDSKESTVSTNSSSSGGVSAHNNNNTSNSSDDNSRNLLYDDDTELESLLQALVRVHNEFYFEFEAHKNQPPDVKDIMTEMKKFVFNECVFLFSGILPLGTRLDSADIVIWARSFGASVVPNYIDSVTHIICRTGGTFKVRLAKTLNPEVKVVHPDWLFKCIALWEQVPEDDYLVEDEEAEAEIEDIPNIKKRKREGEENETDHSEAKDEKKVRSSSVNGDSKINNINVVNKVNNDENDENDDSNNGAHDRVDGDNEHDGDDGDDGEDDEELEKELMAELDNF